MSMDGEDNPFNAAMLGGAQTSTSKALLLFIHVPKILRVHIAKDETKRDRKDSVDGRDGTKTTTEATKPTLHKKTSSVASNKPAVGHRKTPSSSSSKPGHRKTPSASSSKPGHRKTDSFASLRNEVPMVPMDTISSAGISAIPSSINNSPNNTPKGSEEKLLETTNKSVESNRSSNKDDDDTDDKDEDPEILPSGEHEIGYVEAEDNGETKKKNKIEHVITAEEMAAVVNLDALGIEEVKNKEGQVWDAPPAEEPQSLRKAVKNFFGIVTNKEDEVTSRLNREEAIRIVKAQNSIANLPDVEEEEETKGPAPNTEIKVHALLQLTCKNLFKEGCFFTAPAQINITKGEQLDEWIQFTIMCKPNSIDLVLERLERIGVGSSVGMISIYKSELLKTADWPKLDESPADAAAAKKDEKKPSSAERKSNKQAKAGDTGVLVEEAKQEWKNAASRMRVEQIKEQIHEQAAMSFDFVALLLIASILAGIGLIANSTVVIVASMLVSPIMGPVMGITFGSRVLDWKLARSSAFNEVGALLIAVLTGAVVGFASAFSEFADDWPTEEMSSRGDVGGLITGIAIAIPSGMGVALSILGNNTASLVGVAISASLLPPAVNAGVCWAHAILIQAGHVSNEADFVTIGAISFALTLINIVCIWVFGIVMFTIKEVAPSEKKSAFWARDIKVARATQKRGSLRNEVDIEKIKAGLQEALEQKREEEDNLEGAKVTAKAKYMKRWRRRNKPADFSFSLIDDSVNDDDVDYLEFFMLGLNPLMEETQGLHPNDRAAYLGFRASVQDFAIEEEPVPEKPAWMSFFGR